MREVYRIYHYSNGHQFRVNGVVSAVAHQNGHTILLSDNETLEIERGWIALQIQREPAQPIPALMLGEQRLTLEEQIELDSKPWQFPKK